MLHIMQIEIVGVPEHVTNMVIVTDLDDLKFNFGGNPEYREMYRILLNEIQTSAYMSETLNCSPDQDRDCVGLGIWEDDKTSRSNRPTHSYIPIYGDGSDTSMDKYLKIEEVVCTK